MTNTKRHAERVLLMLDIAAENPLDPQEVLELRGGSTSSTKVFEVTEFGAVRSGRGWDPSRRRGYSAAIDAMLIEARPHVGPTTDLIVAGRAGLASFAELGLRLSSWHDEVTLVNKRKTGQWDMCSINGTQYDAEPFFDQIHFPRRPADTKGRVAVVVSSGYEVDGDKISEFFEREREPLLATVVLRAVPPTGATTKVVNARNTPTLARTLCAELGKVQLNYPGQRGLAVFVVGPAQLAFLAGRAINPNVYSSVWFPHKDGDSYQMGSKVPWVDKVRVCMLMAGPDDLGAIDLSEEEKQALTVLDRPLARDRVDISINVAATFDDLFGALLRIRPQIVHFAGHGREDALGFIKMGSGEADVVPGEALVRALRSASDRHDPPRLVVLNACKSSAQAKALTACVDFAIGMPFNVKDERAIAFTRRFYDALASGRSLKNAFDQAHAFLSKWGEHAAKNLELHERPGCDADDVRFFEP